MQSLQSPANAGAAIWAEKRVISICFLIALSQFQYGFDSAAVAGFQSVPGFLAVFGYPDPKNPIGFNLRTTVQTLIQSLMQVGGLMASIFIFKFGIRLSRRKGLWIACLLSVISAAIQIGITHTGALYVGRLILGLSNGFYLPHSVLYMGEISPAALRGSIVGMVTFQTSFGALMGILVDNYTAPLFSKLAYQIPLAVVFGPPVLISIALIFLPDTPRFYVSRDQLEKAADSIRKLRGITDETRIREDVALIKKAWDLEIELHSQARFLDAFKGTDLRRTMISISCAVGQTATGIIFLSSFSVYFFVQANIGSPFVWVMISLAIALTGNMSAFPAMRFISRRLLLMTCSCISAACMFGMAIVYTVSGPASHSAGRALVGLSIVYTWIYGIGQGPVLWAIQTEVPSQRLRSQTVSLSQGINFVFAWLCAYCTPYFINPSALNWGPKYCYIVSSPDRRKTIPFSTYSLLLLCQRWYMLMEIRSGAPVTSSLQSGFSCSFLR